MRTMKTTALITVLLFPILASAQWIEPTNSTIASDCTTAPCKVQINPGNTTNTGVALEAGGDVLATGVSTDVGATSTAGPAAVWASAPTGEVAAILLRSGASEAVQLRREPTSNDFTIFTSNLERFRITSGGKVGINVTSPNARLSVFENLDGATASTIAINTNVESNASQLDYGLLLYATQNNYPGITNTGRLVGVQADVRNTGSGHVSYIIGSRVWAGIQTGATGTALDAYAFHAQVINGGGSITNGYGVYIADTQATNDYGIFQVSADDNNQLAGNTGIGGAATTKKLEVYGDAHVSGTLSGGNIQAKYQDVAEWVPATEDLTPGTVVILNPDQSNEVMPSARSYDTSVAGVVSAQPGLILGEAGPSKEQIATTGRVRVRVDARTQPIRIGDLLVTSDQPGMAMRSMPMVVNGRPFHQPGTIVGKALESLGSGVGEILVLLSMQ